MSKLDAPKVPGPGSRRLEQAGEEDALEMMKWFPTAARCHEWGGPEFRFPFTPATFREDMQLERLPSYVLLDAGDGALMGFGQYYARLDRCHLARIVVAPPYRGRRIGEGLILELARTGCAALGADECSLFVLPGNERALRLYRRMGFVEEPYVGESLPGSLYMVASFAEMRRQP